MDEDAFWLLIARTREEAGGDDDEHVVLLREQLAELDEDDILAFDVLVDELMARSYRRELWAAAHVINNGCSDDGFDYFRGWLIAQGRATFERAIADPATLEEALVMDPAWDAQLEELLYVARQAYKRRTAFEMPERPRVVFELQGATWTKKTVSTLFPDLARKAAARYRSG